MLFVATETDAEKEKRARIEGALSGKSATLKTWQQLAIEDYGLVNGKSGGVGLGTGY